MLSFPDIAILGGLALIVFGPDRLPGVARQVGQAVGVMRSTSQLFVREMERMTQPPDAAPPRPVEASTAIEAQAPTAVASSWAAPLAPQALAAAQTPRDAFAPSEAHGPVEPHATAAVEAHPTAAHPPVAPATTSATRPPTATIVTHASVTAAPARARGVVDEPAGPALRVGDAPP